MSLRRLSRREFAGALGAGVGATLAWPEVGGGVARAMLPLGVPEKGTIQINSNENPYGPSAKARKALASSLERAAGRYPDAERDELLAALSKRHGVPPDHIVLGCGSTEILRIADMAFLGPGKTLVAADTTYEAVYRYATLTRAESVRVPLTPDFRHDLPRMAETCSSSTGLVYVCNPNNPTATLVHRDELAAFLGAVPKTAVVLVDEAYHHFVEDRQYATALDALGRHPNLVVSRTFSKIYGLAGLRLGYAVAATREVASAMRQHLVSFNTNAAALAAARASFEDDRTVADQRRRNAETRAWLCAELARDGRRFLPSHANFLMIDVGGDVVPVIEAFRQRGLLVGRKFPTMASWLRVSIGTPKEMRAFLDGLRVIVPVTRNA